MVSADVPPERKPERGYVRQNHPFTKPPFYLPVSSLKALLFPPLFNKVQNKGTQGVQARYGAELPPFISIVRCPSRPIILGMDLKHFSGAISFCRRAALTWGVAKGSSISGVAKFKGDKNSESRLSNGWS